MYGIFTYIYPHLGDFVRANVGIHIPAPWFASGILRWGCLSPIDLILSRTVRVWHGLNHIDITLVGGFNPLKNVK